jgi:hypothetical protein
VDREAPSEPATSSPRARLEARGLILIALAILVLDLILDLVPDLVLVLDRIRSFHRLHRSTT